MFGIILIVLIVVCGLSAITKELGGKWLDIKKLKAEETVLRLKADPKFEEREDFVRHAIQAHDDLL